MKEAFILYLSSSDDTRGCELCVGTDWLSVMGQLLDDPPSFGIVWSFHVPC